jgi:hypothetical protein
MWSGVGADHLSDTDVAEAVVGMALHGIARQRAEAEGSVTVLKPRSRKGGSAQP